ncbi:MULTISPECIES: low molecular weight protein tyrosine phosphatase family protein [unclassified Rhodanobacter]|uniref:low molecular weight protein tyrosine phosphatase family protein n=1 Tax=unclassified Rhodanobacter TaxID=2621553 RepID=UPI001BDE6B36|nr:MULTISPECIES: low molecular weight protein tyrosine phosphatase family protein [unclassified Rhodanobacter]MBT2144147.1 low molecular weight protein tyrosine phosphatase family protein [Rhodanobacter sp. LX-99]MBT2150186.1 low molecular weight protein tyrosine phosphatase family protein [Rhodanobacter sp. LX-100]
MAPRRVLFLCSRNRLRSPTAEQVFGTWPNLEVDSAGLADDAETALTAEQLDWAELIVVMESSHRRRLQARHRTRLKGKRVVCLDIPDDYTFMQPELVALLLKKVEPLLR